MNKKTILVALCAILLVLCGLSAQAGQWTRLQGLCEQNNRDAVFQELRNNNNINYINTPDSYGNTALHIACQNQQDGIVMLLLAHGADVNAHNQRGETPLNIAHNLYNGNPNNPARHNIMRALLNKSEEIEQERPDQLAYDFANHCSTSSQRPSKRLKTLHFHN